MENQSHAESRPHSIPYAAERLGVSRPTIYRLIVEGKLRTYKVGRAHRVSDAAIDECIAGLERENAARRVAAPQPKQLSAAA